MVRPSERRLKKKFVRTPGGKTKVKYERKKPGKARCAITKKPLQGTPKNKNLGKLAKTKKRPSVMFGGILSNKARDIVFEEAIKVKTGVKSIDDVKLSYRKYVEQALPSIGK